ncbi:MAG: hypothetical protein HFJ53_03865 [Clostridia bacterium]|nr:hypothetical protein [Clostridia bacterium]
MRKQVNNNDNKIPKTNKKKVGLVLIIMLIIVICFSYSIVQLIKHPTDTFMIENGKLSQEETVVGYIIRNETVIQGNNYKNGMMEIKSEGEKVSKGEPVFRYYSNNEETLVKKIQELDIKIQEAMENQNDLFSSDIKLLEKQIDEKLEEFKNINDIKKLEELKKDINTQMTKKAKIAGELSPAGSYMRKLIMERSSYENSLNSGAEYIKASESGIVSYRVDGLENVLTKDAFSTLNKKFLDDLKLKTGEIVASNTESGKIIDNFAAYIATNLTSEESKNAKIGDKVTLHLSNAEEINAKIEYISEEENSRLIIFKIEEAIEFLSSYRKISFDIIWWRHNGLKVPNTSLIIEKAPEGIESENLYYVQRKRMNYIDKILVKVLKQNKDYAIIRNYETEELKTLGYDQAKIKQLQTLMLHDEILIKP